MKIRNLIAIVFVITFFVGCADIQPVEKDLDTVHQSAETLKFVELQDGESYDLAADMIKHLLIDKEYDMYGYGGNIPGPIFKVMQGSRATINFQNNIDMETTVHWHGLRHNVQFDGVPGISQDPVKPGESFTYELFFPDPGFYWHHPHAREDKQQDLGLYGGILVEPKEKDYWNQVNREEIIFFDDILIKDNTIVPYGKEHANFALMGRFGNTLLINGHTRYYLEAKKGELIRFYLTNTANVRPFQLSFGGLNMKLVGSDIGRVEKEILLDNIMLSVAERHIIEVLFDKSGVYDVTHTTPDKTYKIGTIKVLEEEVEERLPFEELKNNNDITPEFEQYLDQEVDFDFELTVKTSIMNSMMEHNMGMMTAHEGIEWEDPMPMMNSRMTTENVKWIIRDRKTGRENRDIKPTVKVGDKKKIRLFNNPDSAHPMQHPFHLHGQRFLITHIDGKPVEKLEWKETITITVGETVDILIDFTNPGEWVFHCHIPEHLEAGMMTAITVS